MGKSVAWHKDSNGALGVASYQLVSALALPQLEKNIISCRAQPAGQQAPKRAKNGLEWGFRPEKPWVDLGWPPPFWLLPA